MIRKQNFWSALLKIYLNHSFVYNQSDYSISKLFMMASVPNAPIGNSVFWGRSFLFFNLFLAFKRFF